MKTKCSQCFKLFLESEIDNCDKCGKNVCIQCLTYYGKEKRLAFCPKCEVK